MLHFPISYKPELNLSQYEVLHEYKNVITENIADDLISLASNDMGWHRRGAKSVNVSAQFSTVQLHDSTHEVYQIMDNLWKEFTDRYDYKIDFVEYLEVKGYSIGDHFDPHVDVHGNVNETLDRKLNMIIQLSDSKDYEGGDLYVRNMPATRERCSAIIFPASYSHHVTKIVSGMRYCLIGHAWGHVYRK